MVGSRPVASTASASLFLIRPKVACPSASEPSTATSLATVGSFVPEVDSDPASFSAAFSLAPVSALGVVEPEVVGRGAVPAAPGDEKDDDDDHDDRRDPAAEQPGFAAAGKRDRAPAGGRSRRGRRRDCGRGAAFGRRLGCGSGVRRRLGGVRSALGSRRGSGLTGSGSGGAASAAGFAPPGTGDGTSGTGLPSASNWARAPTTFARTSVTLSPIRAAMSSYPCSPEASRRSIAFCSSLSATPGNPNRVCGDGGRGFD